MPKNLTEEQWLRKMKRMKRLCCFCRKDVPLGAEDTYTIQLSRPAALEYREGDALLWTHGECWRNALAPGSADAPKSRRSGR